MANCLKSDNYGSLEGFQLNKKSMFQTLVRVVAALSCEALSARITIPAVMK